MHMESICMCIIYTVVASRDFVWGLFQKVRVLRFVTGGSWRFW